MRAVRETRLLYMRRGGLKSVSTGRGLQGGGVEGAQFITLSRSSCCNECCDRGEKEPTSGEQSFCEHSG
jgi:hypothetical protein